MTTAAQEPQDADPTQLEDAGAAIDEAKAAAGRVARDDSIDTGGDLPTEDENVPAVPESPSSD
jgi:hypothetical protein